MINFIKLSRITLTIFCLFFSFYSIQYYEGSKYLFLIFNFSILILTYYLTSTNSSFFSFFLAFYLFMGFWFKYNFSLVFNNGYVFDSGLLNSSNIDNALIISIYLFIVIIIASFLEKIYFKYEKFNTFNRENLFTKFYLNNKIIVLSLFIIFFLSIAFINFNFKIYVKGLIFDNNYNQTLLNLLKWLLLFGYSTFSCFILNSNFLSKKRNTILIFFIVFFEIFISNTSMLSRSMLLFGLPFLYSFIFYASNQDNFYRKFIIILSIYIFFSTFSIYLANELRSNYIKEFQSSLKTEMLNKKTLTDESEDNLTKANRFNFQLNEVGKGQVSAKRMTTFIIINRWTGIDSLINVSNSKNLGFDLFLNSFEEKKSKIGNTFYEKNFNLEYQKPSFSTKNIYVKGNTLPGIFSFIYYTGSILFLLTFSFIIFMIFSLLEKKIYKITNNNIFYVAFLSHIIVNRLFSFGYAPKDTYLFVTSLILSIIFIYVLESDRFEKIFNSLK